MRAAGGIVLMLAITLGVGACGDSEPQPERPSNPARRAHLAECVEAWNSEANFAAGSAGSVVRRLERASVDPLFAHVSRDHRGRCVVFVDTIADVDDRRFVRSSSRFRLDCKGPCGDQAPPGSRTFRFNENGSLPGL